MKKIFILMFLLSNQLYFGQCDDQLIKMLKGVWVKTTGSADTIKFSMINDRSHNFELILANVPRPQGGPAGPYEFRALGTTMLVRWFPSSYSGAQTTTFFFDRSLKVFTIGNFYQAEKEGKSLVFRKIK